MPCRYGPTRSPKLSAASGVLVLHNQSAMCGICGTIGIPNAADAARLVGNMNAAMFHRGPDEQGELIAPAAAPYASIGMRRLSIIDLSGGHQPVFNEAGDVAIVFNGEIYDFTSLRE